MFDFLIEDINENDKGYYVFFGNPLSWENEQEPPQTTNSDNDTFLNPKNNIICGKRIKNENVTYLIKKRFWEPNKIYSAYTNDNSNFDFYVINKNYSVYKCIYSPGTISEVEPETILRSGSFSLGDGYVWKFMYTLTQNEYENFATTDYIPVKNDPNVKASAISGAIDAIVVENGGSNYNTFNQGSIQAILNADKTKFRVESSSTQKNVPDFFKNNLLIIEQNTNVFYSKIISSSADFSGTSITTEEPLNINNNLEETTYTIAPYVDALGDGEDFLGYCVPNNNQQIQKVFVINPGRNYTIAELRLNTNPNEGSGAILIPAISPQNGHGFDAITELGSNKICISVNFEGTEFNEIPVDLSFRSAGILYDPKKRAVPSESFLMNTFNQIQNLKLIFSDESKTLRQGDIIVGRESKAFGIVINNSNIRTTIRSNDTVKILTLSESFENENFSVRGKPVSGEIVTVDEILPDIDKYSGEILYIQHFTEIFRRENSTEEFKLIITI